MTETSARFALPHILPGQAQKELFHNEALALIDAALHPVAESIGDDDPPVSPDIGQCWIVGATPTGEWTGMAQKLACWTIGGWRFVSPAEGMAIWLPAAGLWARHAAGAWSEGVLPVAELHVDGLRVVGAREPSIAAPSGGTTVDSEARSTIALMLAALRNHGLIAT